MKQYQIWRNKAMLWRWRLVDTENGKKICNPGEFFFSKANCKRNIALVKLAADAPIVEVAK